MDLALSEEAFVENKKASGLKFYTQQSISGNGFMSAYRCFNSDPNILKSHSSGSGAYSSDSNILDEDIVLSNMIYEDYSSSKRSVKFNDNVSAAYFPTTISPGGSARFGPIKSTWSDSTQAGNHGGAVMKAAFDSAKSLVKHMATEVSGFLSIDAIERSAGSFEACMELNSAFNGTAQLSATVLDQSQPDDWGTPETAMDEYYRGAFSLTKKMKISQKRSRSTGVDDWMPCCIDGYKSMATYYQRGTYGFGPDVKGVFDCTCFKTPASAEFQRAY